MHVVGVAAAAGLVAVVGAEATGMVPITLPRFRHATGVAAGGGRFAPIIERLSAATLTMERPDFAVESRGASGLPPRLVSFGLHNYPAKPVAADFVFAQRIV